MKKSTVVIKSNDWSWLLSAVTSIFSIASSDEAKIISLELFKRLPVDILLHISGYLPSRYMPRAQKHLANRALMFSVSYDNNVDSTFKGLLQKNYLLEKFLYLVAIEGEDNQAQAEAILKQLLKEKNYALMSRLISYQTPVTDAAGRRFKSISALGYTFWAGDTRMSRMMEKYVNILEEKGDEITRKKVGSECQHIEDQGIEFTFNGERVEHSEHFNWQPLIAAYHAFIAAATRLITVNEWRNDAWVSVDRMWLNIGKELIKVPTHVAQEYCSEISFSPLSNFKAALNNPAIKRTVKFYNLMSDKADKMESWLICGLANPNFGSLFSIYKGANTAGFSFQMGGWLLAGGPAVPAQDLLAVAALCEMRTINDRHKTLENLNPMILNLDRHP